MTPKEQEDLEEYLQAQSQWRLDPNNPDFKQKVFAYLTELRDGGGLNMWSCAPYLMERFGVDKSEAKELFMQWIEHCRRVSA